MAFVTSHPPRSTTSGSTRAALLRTEEQLTQIKKRDHAVAVRIMRIKAMSSGFAETNQDIEHQTLSRSIGCGLRPRRFSSISSSTTRRSRLIRGASQFSHRSNERQPWSRNGLD